MATALEYQIKLVDLMSGPATQADSAIGQLAAEMKLAAIVAKSLTKEELAASKAILKQEEAAKKAADQQAKAAAAAQAKAEKLAEKQNAAAEKSALAAQKKADAARIKEAKKLQAELEKVSEANKQYMADFSAATVDGLEAFAGAAAAAGAAVLGLGVVLGSLVLGGAKLAIQAAEAKQDTLDLLDAMLGSQEAAQDVYKRIGDITRDVAISQERATGLARELTAAGITNKDALTNAIKSIGQVESVLGNEAGGKIQNILEKAAQTGEFKLNPKQLLGTGVQVQKLYEQIAKDTHKSTKQVEAELKAGKISAEVGIAALTKVLDTKFAGPAAGQVLDLGNQLQRLKDNIGRLFEDVDTGPFLKALHAVLDLFDEESVTGKGLKQVLTSIFNGVFDAATAVLPYIKTGLKGLFIILLQVGIALKPLIKSIRDAFGGEQTSGLDSFASALSTIGSALGTVVGWMVKLAQNEELIAGIKFLFWGVVAAVGALGVGIATLLAPMYALGAAFVYVLGLGSEFISWAYTAGSDLINGLVKGLVDSGVQVGAAVHDIAVSALKKFKDVFGIHSPSKVMASMGGHLMDGLVQGIDLGSKVANDTLAAAVSPPPAQAGAVGASQTFNNTSGPVSIVINIQGIAGANELKEMMPDILADAFEQAGLTQGAPQAA